MYCGALHGSRQAIPIGCRVRSACHRLVYPIVELWTSRDFSFGLNGDAHSRPSNTEPMRNILCLGDKMYSKMLLFYHILVCWRFLYTSKSHIISHLPPNSDHLDYFEKLRTIQPAQSSVIHGHPWWSSTSTTELTQQAKAPEYRYLNRTVEARASKRLISGNKSKGPSRVRQHIRTYQETKIN